MAISQQTGILETAMWPQGDIRDPIGIWGGSLAVTGDASGDDVRVQFQVAADKRAAYVYTVYSANIVAIVGAFVLGNVSARILTNWPNINPDAGIQGYDVLVGRTFTDTGSSPLDSAPNNPLISPLDRFLLCLDPSNLTPGPMDILELKVQTNTLNSVWVFSCYGYFWDRSVLNAPGGPRHPGAS